MQRAHLQLLAAVRQGDRLARCEAGRRYLLGMEGFPRDVSTGLAYLNHPSVRDLSASAIAIAEGLSLEELIHQDQEAALKDAARHSSRVACAKLALLLFAQSGRLSAEILALIEKSGVALPQAVQEAANAGDVSHATPGLVMVLRAAAQRASVKPLRVAAMATRAALQTGRLTDAGECLHLAEATSEGDIKVLAELAVALIEQAERNGEDLPPHLPALKLHHCLEYRALRGDVHAMHTLGRSLCGLPCGVIPPGRLSPGVNLRRGVAALLRAGDTGCAEAWFLLYQLHGDRANSVTNPHAARVYLEKAAAQGMAEAQHQLGLLLLRSASCAEDTERALGLLHLAANRGHAAARATMESLVTPVSASSVEASLALLEIQREDAALAMRLELARAFGLTRFEALTVNPALGMRAWGLMLQPQPSASRSRPQAPRAVPATVPHAMETLRRAAAFFNPISGAREGSLESRTRALRRTLQRLDVSEALFFSPASGPGRRPAS